MHLLTYKVAKTTIVNKVVANSINLVKGSYSNTSFAIIIEVAS